MVAPWLAGGNLQLVLPPYDINTDMVLRRFAGKILAVGAAALLMLAASGCETLQFYRQAAWGQWQIMSARQDVEELMADSGTAVELSERLQLTQEVLGFAEQQLGLAANGRYSTYVELGREYVLWNVFAARPFSLDEDQWCYPIVGCAPYRGYFDEQRARQVAQRYNRRGFETYVGGVPAYSTLGWFEDPLLSSFVVWPAADLVNLLLHELAHSRVWVNGDVAFNESFAEFVGNRGAQAWFAQRGEVELWRQWRSQRRGWLTFRAFAVTAKSHLQSVYTGPTEDLAEGKRRALEAFQACYRAHRETLGGGRYDELMSGHFNNAFLLSIGTYADWLPAFSHLFEQSGSDWSAFFTAVQSLADLDHVSRETRLEELSRAPLTQQLLTQQEVSHGTDHRNAHEVNCEPFLGHGAHTESAG